MRKYTTLSPHRFAKVFKAIQNPIDINPDFIFIRKNK